MIDAISLSKIATYGDAPEALTDLGKVNFIFGTNGTGKTTISRIIADEGLSDSCKIQWKGGSKLQALVYNRDFVQKNFNEPVEMKGVFTLGSRQVDAVQKVETAKKELNEIKLKIENLNNVLNGEDGNGGKMSELKAHQDDIQEKCWSAYGKHKEKLSDAFEGVRNSKKDFRTRTFKELAENTAVLVPLDDLVKRAATVFGLTPVLELAVTQFNAETLIDYEADEILKKRVIGKEDVDIADMIKKLGNSDWVREGRGFHEVNDNACPFCQQPTPEKFSASLAEYFNESFERDTKAIGELLTNYKTESARLQENLASILAMPSRFINLVQLKIEGELLDSILRLNVQHIVAKGKEPSRVIKLESITNVIKGIQTLIEEANQEVLKHNTTVKNLTQERRKLTAEVWKHVLEVNLKTDLASYKSKTDALSKAIISIEAKALALNEDKQTKIEVLRELEKQTTSIQPTIDAINALLLSFGFHGFGLDKGANGSSYKLIRPDNTDAKETLSEGERTFVTFLYFYHLLKGSNSSSDVSTDRVVVIDDPVSSLDSDILFIVGNLIKKLFDEVREGKSQIKQVFMLTHNVYFHKEVSFNPKRSDCALSDESFWVVRKSGKYSKLVRHRANPIQTSYELLWSEVKNPDRSNLSIQNVLRRILENYFKFFGGVDPKEICKNFPGKDQLICNSLLSWINDGSHYAHDDLYMTIDDTVVDAHLRVFHQIFVNSGQEAHYKMMMGEPFDVPNTIEKEALASSKTEATPDAGSEKAILKEIAEPTVEA